MTQFVSIKNYSVFLLVFIALTQVNTAQGQQLVRKGDASAGAVSYVALTTTGGLIITAVRDNSGNLKLISWRNSADGLDIERLGSASAGGISRVAIVSMGQRRFLTAVRDNGGNLKLIGWVISADGLEIKRLSSASAGAISEVAISVLNSTQFVTAVRDGNGNLKLIAWNFHPNNQIDVREALPRAPSKSCLWRRQVRRVTVWLQPYAQVVANSNLSLGGSLRMVKLSVREMSLPAL